MDSLTHASSGALVGGAFSQIVLPEAWLASVLIGAVAGSIVDIDFLAELHSKKAAWKYHRIIAHNIPVAFALGLIVALIGCFWLPLPLSLLICSIAISLHLCLDVLTSFGTCLWYPFNKKRYSTRSHFIFDPWVLGISVYGVFSHQALLCLLLLIAYLVLTCVLKPLIQIQLSKSLPDCFEEYSLHIEPTFLAPFRWLLIVPTDEGYVYSYQTLIWRSRWYAQDFGDVEFVKLCQEHELMNYVLETFDMPIYTYKHIGGESFLIVEDVKWRLEPGLRPLAFTLKLEKFAGKWKIIEASQGGFFQKSNTELFTPVKYWAN